VTREVAIDRLACVLPMSVGSNRRVAVPTSHSPRQGLRNSNAKGKVATEPVMPLPEGRVWMETQSTACRASIDAALRTSASPKLWRRVVKFGRNAIAR